MKLIRSTKKGNVKAAPDDCDFDNIPGLCSGEQSIEAENAWSRTGSAKGVTLKKLRIHDIDIKVKVL
jgi:hypothetical protein